jgi:hypothetical protein
VVTSKIDGNTTAVHHPVYRTCIVRVDRDLVLRCQRAGAKPYRGITLGSLPDLYPHDALKRAMLPQAKEFLRHMKGRGLEPKVTEYTLELWGPYRDRLNFADAASPMINIEEGNPFFPNGRWVSAARSAGPAQKGPLELSEELLDHPDMRRGVHMLVRGLFLRHFGKEEETTGTILV